MKATKHMKEAMKAKVAAIRHNIKVYAVAKAGRITYDAAKASYAPLPLDAVMKAMKKCEFA